jgi:hypothetical protein
MAGSLRRCPTAIVYQHWRDATERVVPGGVEENAFTVAAAESAAAEPFWSERASMGESTGRRAGPPSPSVPRSEAGSGQLGGPAAGAVSVVPVSRFRTRAKIR